MNSLFLILLLGASVALAEVYLPFDHPAIKQVLQDDGGEGDAEFPGEPHPCIKRVHKCVNDPRKDDECKQATCFKVLLLCMKEAFPSLPPELKQKLQYVKPCVANALGCVVDGHGHCECVNNFGCFFGFLKCVMKPICLGPSGRPSGHPSRRPSGHP